MTEIEHKLAILKPFSDFHLSDASHGSQLLHGLNELRRTKTFCNVFLKTRPEHQGFAVHREVLVAFSPYLKELCQRQNDSAISQDIVLQEFGPSVLVTIIEYFYTGVTTITSENVQDIFNASALLQLKTLHSISKIYLIKCISPHNCLQVMSLGQKHNSRQLLEKARQFFGANFARVVQSSDFPNIEAKDLKVVISSDYLVIQSEAEVYEAVKRWIEYDSQERLKYVPLLMSQVRFRFMPQEFLTTTYKQDPIMKASPLSEDFVHEAIVYESLSPDEQQRVHTIRVMERWCTQSTEVLLLVGGASPEPEQNFNHWAFDPVTIQWYIISPLQSSRHMFGVAQCDDGLYVFGGLKNMTEDKFLATVEMYDAKLDKWKPVKKSMREARCRFDAVSFGEIVYFVGGMCNDPGQNTLEMYYHNMAIDQSSAQKVFQMSAPKQPRYEHCTAALIGKIYFIGGYTRGHQILNAVECYDPDQNTWSDIAPLLVPRTGACAVTVGDYIIVIGGSNSKKPLSSCEIYDPSKNKWEYITPMSECRDHCTAACFNNKIYVFGGSYGRVIHNSVECYNFKTNTWRVVSHLPAEKNGFKCVKSVVNRSLVQEIAFEQV